MITPYERITQMSEQNSIRIDTITATKIMHKITLYLFSTLPINSHTSSLATIHLLESTVLFLAAALAAILSCKLSDSV